MYKKLVAKYSTYKRKRKQFQSLQLTSFFWIHTTPPGRYLKCNRTGRCIINKKIIFFSRSSSVSIHAGSGRALVVHLQRGWLHPKFRYTVERDYSSPCYSVKTKNTRWRPRRKLQIHLWWHLLPCTFQLLKHLVKNSILGASHAPVSALSAFLTTDSVFWSLEKPFLLQLLYIRAFDTSLSQIFFEKRLSLQVVSTVYQYYEQINIIHHFLLYSSFGFLQLSHICAHSKSRQL